MEFKKRFIGQGKVGGRHGRDDQFPVFPTSEIEQGRLAVAIMSLTTVQHTLGYNLVNICAENYIIM